MLLQLSKGIARYFFVSEFLSIPFSRTSTLPDASPIREDSEKGMDIYTLSLINCFESSEGFLKFPPF